jgi:hypothetical protein
MDLQQPTFRHNLGARAKDRVSGLHGIIVSRSEHLFGCARYWVQPQSTKDGKPAEGAWFDEDSIDVIEEAAIKPRRYRVVEEDASDLHPRDVMRVGGGPTHQPASHVRTQPRR